MIITGLSSWVKRRLGVVERDVSCCYSQMMKRVIYLVFLLGLLAACADEVAPTPTQHATSLPPAPTSEPTATATSLPTDLPATIVPTATPSPFPPTLVPTETLAPTVDAQAAFCEGLPKQAWVPPFGQPQLVVSLEDAKLRCDLPHCSEIERVEIGGDKGVVSADFQWSASIAQQSATQFELLVTHQDGRQHTLLLDGQAVLDANEEQPKVALFAQFLGQTTLLRYGFQPTGGYAFKPVVEWTILDVERGHQWQMFPEPVWRTVLSVDESRAFGVSDDGVWVVELTREATAELIPFELDSSEAAFIEINPSDPNQLIVPRLQGLVVVDVVMKTTRFIDVPYFAITHPHYHQFPSYVWEADNVLLFASPDVAGSENAWAWLTPDATFSVYRLEINSGEVQKLQTFMGDVSQAAFSPDGRLIQFIRGPRNVNGQGRGAVPFELLFGRIDSGDVFEYLQYDGVISWEGWYPDSSRFFYTVSNFPDRNTRIGGLCGASHPNTEWSRQYGGNWGAYYVTEARISNGADLFLPLMEFADDSILELIQGVRLHQKYVQWRPAENVPYEAVQLESIQKAGQYGQIRVLESEAYRAESVVAFSTMTDTLTNTLSIYDNTGNLLWQPVQESRRGGLGYSTYEPLAISADQTHFYYTTKTVADGCGISASLGTLWQLNLFTGRTTIVYDQPSVAIAVSPDDATLAALNGNWIILHDIATQTERKVQLPLLTTNMTVYADLGWEQQGNQIVVKRLFSPCSAESHGSLLILNLLTETLHPIVERDERIGWHQLDHWDGWRLELHHFEGETIAVDMENGTVAVED